MTDADVSGKERTIRPLYGVSEDHDNCQRTIIQRTHDNYVKILQDKLECERLEKQSFKEENVRLRDLVDKDSLTGLYNQRYLEDAVEKRVARERRKGRSWGILMIDIDLFKSVNDKFGHPVGDAVLKNVAKMLQCISRGSDIVIRYGGEEFCIVVFDIDSIGELADLAERQRKAVAVTATRHNGRDIFVTVSTGACFVPSDSAMELRQVIKYADSALYEAKDAGRDRVVVSDRRKVIRSKLYT